MVLVTYAPIVPRTTVVKMVVTVPVPNSPVKRQTLELAIPLTTVTFHTQTIDLPIDQWVNVTFHNDVRTDLVALLPNSTTEGFIQAVISEVGVPIGPSLFTGKDMSPIIIPLIREKLPAIMEKIAHGHYYRLNQGEDAASLELRAGRYNLVVLSFSSLGGLQFRISYLSADSTTETISQLVTERVSILRFILG